MSTERSDAPGDPGVNDDARPDGAAPPATASSPSEPAAPPAPADIDPDEAELAAARAAVAAEEAAAAGGAPGPAAATPATPPAAAAPQPGAPQQPPAAPQAGQQPPNIMVPKARFDEVARRLRDTEARLLMASGAIEVLTGQVKPGQAATPPQQGSGAPPAAAAPTPQQTIEGLEAQILAAAEKFDAGELTMAEFKRQEAALNQQILAAREEALLAKVPKPAAPEPGVADQAIQAQHLNTLYAKHPYAAGLSEPQAKHLAQMAALELAAEGQPVGTGPLETMRLQARVAALSDAWGPKWGIQPTHAPTPSPQSQSQPPANGAPRMSPQAQARQDKLALAARLPPDTASLGAGAVGDDAVSEQRIEMMSDDEIMALPASVRARFLA